MCACLYADACVLVYIFTRLWVYICECVCICVYICVRMLVFVSIFMFCFVCLYIRALCICVILRVYICLLSMCILVHTCLCCFPVWFSFQEWMMELHDALFHIKGYWKIQTNGMNESQTSVYVSYMLMTVRPDSIGCNLYNRNTERWLHRPSDIPTPKKNIKNAQTNAWYKNIYSQKCLLYE